MNVVLLYSNSRQVCYKLKRRKQQR